MPRENFVLILLALALFVLCSKVTIRDRILIESLHAIQREALVEPSGRLLFEGAMAGMTRQLNTEFDDVYSAYIPPGNKDEYEASLENRFDGIGIIYRRDPIDKSSEILYPVPDSPAFTAGIRSGDRILNVNGKATEKLSFAEISKLFRGETGTSVELTIRPFGRHSGKAEPTTLSVPRKRILKTSVEGDRIDETGKRIFRLETEPDIAYLRITTFSDRTADDVRAALERISADGAKGLVLDLRDNAGGYVSTCVETAGLFLEATPEENVIVSIRFRDGTTKYAYPIPEGNRICTLPMVVLIDGETASASEILAAALQDYRRAEIVGTRSFGKGVVQEITELPLNSGVLQLTYASYWRPSNRNIHRAHDAGKDDEWGVTPDLEGLVKITGSQRFASLEIRGRRSNSISDDTDKLLEDFLKRIPDEVENYRKEMRRYRQRQKELAEENEDAAMDGIVESGPTESDEPEEDDSVPFVLQGTAPYFDTQLDRALELLKKRM